MADRPVVVALNTELPQDIAANNVQAKFAQHTLDLSVEIGRMSGFVIVVFDDEGNPMSSLYFGDYFRIPRPMVPKVVEQLCTTDIYEAT